MHDANDPERVVAALARMAVDDPALQDADHALLAEVAAALAAGGAVGDVRERLATLVPEADPLPLLDLSSAYRTRVHAALDHVIGWPPGLFVPRASPERFLVFTAPDANRYAHAFMSDGAIAAASASDGSMDVYATAGPGTTQRSGYAGQTILVRPTASFATVRVEPEIAWRTVGRYAMGSAMGVRAQASARFTCSFVVQAFVLDPVRSEFVPLTVSPSSPALARTELVVHTNQAQGHAVFDWGVQTGVVEAGRLSLPFVAEAGRTYAVQVRARVVWFVTATPDPPDAAVPATAADFSTILTSRARRIWVEGLG